MAIGNDNILSINVVCMIVLLIGMQNFVSKHTEISRP